METIEVGFIRNFEAEVHIQYQQMGSKLRNTVRTKDKVIGATTTFQKVGKGTASVKARHGKVPVMNVDHSPVECALRDFYAGDWVDHLDELKININEQQIVAKAGAYALGRKTDELIIAELSRSSRKVGDASDGLTKTKVLSAFESLGECDVPDDGQRFAVIGWKQWSDLLAIDDFSNSSYVGEDELPWKGTQAKRWLGTLWLPHSGLPKSGEVRQCFWYHKSAIGHAIGNKVRTEIKFSKDRDSHFVNNMLAQGAILIDHDNVVTMDCGEFD